MSDEKKKLLKVLVVGNVATGKTSVIRRYTDNTFEDNYNTTIGVDFKFKLVPINGTNVKVQMWDIAGQDRFLGLTRAYYASAAGAIIVFDLFNRASYESAVKWKQDIDDKIELPNGKKIPVLLLGNKSDLLSEQPEKICASNDMINGYVKQNSFYKYSPCSALTGENVDSAIESLVGEIVSRSAIVDPSKKVQASGNSNSSNSSNTVKLTAATNDEKPAGCC